MCRSGLMVVLAIMLMGGKHLHAHQSKIQRKVIATVEAQPKGMAANLLVWMRLSGRRAQRLITRFDANRSARFEGAESLLAGDELAPQTLGGVYAQLDGKPWIPATARAKAKLVDRRTIEVMVLMTYAPQRLFQGRFTVGFRALGKKKEQAVPVTISMTWPLSFAVKLKAPHTRRKSVSPKSPWSVEVRYSAHPFIKSVMGTTYGGFYSSAFKWGRTGASSPLK